ncbi:MAG: hypothetical protein LBR89_04905, partial [Holosporales bacterium]|nr:hypothetical protein [Holosporales bacterium]
MEGWKGWRFSQCFFDRALCLSALFGTVAATSCQGNATANVEQGEALPPAVGTGAESGRVDTLPPAVETGVESAEQGGALPPAAGRVDALPPAVIHDFMNACTAFASAADAQDAMSMFIQFAHSNAKNPDTETSRSLVTKAQSLQRYGFS